MDRFKCPLHGKIVARNELGIIVNEKDRLEFEKNEAEKEIAPWMDVELIADINKATGKQIEPVNKDKKRNKKRKSTSDLTDIRNESDTPRQRLQDYLLDPKRMKKIGGLLDSIEKRQNHEKFHHSFHYSLNS
jgi:UV-stimulated scaffold protein A